MSLSLTGREVYPELATAVATAVACRRKSSRPDQIHIACYTLHMVIRAFGKFTMGFLALVAGFYILSLSCGDDGCGRAISSVLSEVKQEKKENIIIETPGEDAQVESPFQVKGTARVFEGRVFFELSDALSFVLAQGSLPTQGENMRKLLPFEGSILYSTPNAPTGTLTLFDRSPKDDSMMDAVSVQVVLSMGSRTSPPQHE